LTLNHFPTNESKAKTTDEGPTSCQLVGGEPKIAYKDDDKLAACRTSRKVIYNAGMPNRQIGVDVLIEDHFWNDAQDQYVYSFHCPACNQLRLTPALGICRCDCGSWLIVTNQK